MTESAPIILVPGAWHGAWCWQKLVPLLEGAGRRVSAPDLPGLGGDDTSLAAVTLETWARFVADLAVREPGCVLVGHSRAGVIISRAAELEPRAIRTLVYLSAFLLPAGTSVATAARRDAGSLLAPNMLPAESGVSCTLRPDIVVDAFYGCCSTEDAAMASGRLAPEPLKVLGAPLRITEDRFGGVPRVYIETLRDRAVSIEAQRRMREVLPCSPVFTLDTDHSPFLSQPEALARMLISI